MFCSRISQLLLTISLAVLTASGASSPSGTSCFGGDGTSGGSDCPPELRDYVYGPEWPDFEERTTRWSTYSAPTFDRLFIPGPETALSDGLLLMSQQNISFLTKSGGHGYSMTLGSVQDAVMINMEEFRYANMNSDMTVTVGSGAVFQDIADALAGAGRELTIGSCPCVGVMGAMLGGGVGRLQGKHGLTSDAVTRLRVVLWNGTIVEASPNVNQNLFWGLRGAGQNFGVVIEATFETYPESNGGRHYNADMTFARDSFESVIDAMNSVLSTDPALALVVFFGVDPETLEPVLAVNLVYAGPENEGRQYTERFAPFAVSINESVIPWPELGALSTGGAVLENCNTGQSHSMWDSVTMDLHKPTFVEIFDSFSSFVAQNPILVDSYILIQIFGTQSIDNRPDDFSAFPHRGSLSVLVSIDMTYTDQSVRELADNWARGWRDTLSSPEVAGYPRMVMYQNYAHGDEPPSALYGYDEWRHERLSALKQSYDPNGFFDGYHPIPRTLSGWS